MNALPKFKKFLLAAIPALVAGMAVPASAFAQAAPPQSQAKAHPSVSVQPTNTTPNDPNAGSWFIATASPGQTVTLKAHIVNPADVPQTVALYLADVQFNGKGVPTFRDHTQATDVGSWGGFDTPTLTIPPHQSADIPFSITPATGVEPGDHIGAVVAEGRPEAAPGGSSLQIIQKVATRLYVTIPGEAQPNIAIQGIKLTKDSSFITKEITVQATIRNTGRVRLHPTVRINGHVAKGSSLLMTNSVEPYIATFKVPVWGGPLTYHVDVQTRVGEIPGRDQTGPARQSSASTFVIPWLLLFGLAVLTGLVFAVRWLWRKRGGKYAAIQADLRRFERLLQQQRAAGEETAEVAGEAELAIKAAIKQAGRAGDKDTEIKLRDKLAELREQEAAPSPPSAPSPAPQSAPVAGGGGDVPPTSSPPADHERALVDVLRELAVCPPGAERFALIREARSFGPASLEEEAALLDTLPESLQARLRPATAGNGEHHSEPSEIA